MSKIFYTSDLHFGHSNIIKYENRPWKTIEEMTQGLIDRWNERIGINDTVYILGDFAWKGSKASIDNINDIVKSLNGKKHLIIGNHDEGWINSIDLKERLWEEITYYKRIEDQGKCVILSHYPIEDWDRQHYGSIHIHGHLHNNPNKIDQPNRYNCGCDLWDWYPITLKEMIDRFGYEEIKENRYGLV